MTIGRVTQMSEPECTLLTQVCDAFPLLLHVTGLCDVDLITCTAQQPAHKVYHAAVNAGSSQVSHVTPSLKLVPGLTLPSVY